MPGLPVTVAVGRVAGWGPLLVVGVVIVGPGLVVMVMVVVMFVPLLHIIGIVVVVFVAAFVTIGASGYL